ncbi:MAG: PAS domain S-box protein, partial [Chloroflexia bacterium]|nr:PAS domain S-box protein [Chloroflexia bacterium]
MDWQYSPYLIPLLMATLASGVLAPFVWSRRSTPGALPAAVFLLCVALWSGGYTLELALADPTQQIFWARIQYLGIAFIPLAWLAFALQYTHRERWLRWPYVLGALVVPLLTLALAWTNTSPWTGGLHHLIWSEIGRKGGPGFMVPDYTYGRWLWGHVAYSYAVMALGALLLLRALQRSPRLYRGQIATLLVGAMVPWLGNVLYLAGLNPFPLLDLTPFAFCLSGLVLAWALLRFRLFDIVPAARDAVIESMSDGVIVLDAQDRVVDLNPAARRILKQPLPQVLGQPVEQAFSGQLVWQERYRQLGEGREEIRFQGRYFDMRLSPLLDRRDRLTGRLLVLRDISERKQAEIELRRQALTFENITDSVILTDMQGRITDCNPATEALFGYSRQELLGQTSVLWHKAGAADSQTERILQGLREHGRWNGEVEFVRQDGQEGICEAVVVPLYDEQDRQIATIGVSRDISERKQVERALRGQKQLFENLVAIARATIEGPTLETTLKSALEVAANLTDAEQGSLFLLDEAGATTHSILLDQEEQLDRGQDIVSRVLDKGLGGWVV